MNDIKSIFSIVNIVLIALVALVVLLKARGGAKRGAYRQPIHLAGVLLTAITAFLVTTIGCNMILSMFEGKEMSDVIATLETSLGFTLDAETAAMIGSFDAQLIAYLLAIPLALLSPLVFFLIYLVACFIFVPARIAVTKFCKVPRRVDTTGKTIGAVLGALEGVLVMAFMLLPITALLRLGVPVIETIDVPDEDLTQVLEGVEEVYESPAIQLVSFVGGEFLADELSTVRLEDSRINLSDELSIGIELVYEISGIMNSEEVSATQREASLNNAIALLKRSNYLPIVFSGAMNIVADAIDEFMPQMPADDPMAALTDNLAVSLKNFLKESRAETVIDDLDTFVQLYIILDTNQVLDIISENPEGAISAFTAKDENGKTVLSKMIATLGSNTRTMPIITALNEISVSVMLQGMGVTGETTEVYNELKTGINNVVSVKKDDFATEEEYKEELKTELKGTINNTIDKILDDTIEIEVSDEDKEKLEDLKETITNDEEVMAEVTDKVDEFLQQNPEIAEGGELDDAELLDFITSNFGDVFADSGFSGFGGGDSQDSGNNQGDGDSQDGNGGNPFGDNDQGAPILPFN